MPAEKAEGAADYVSRHSQNGIGYSHRRQGSPTRVRRRRRVEPGGDYIFSRLSRALMTSARAACRRLICLRRDTRKLPTASDRPRERDGISICRRPLDRPSGCCRLVFCSPNRNWWSSSRGNKTSPFTGPRHSLFVPPMTAPSAAMVERMSLLLMLLAVVAKAVPLPLLNVHQPQNDFLDTSAEYYNDEDFSPLYLNTDIDLLKRDLEIPYELDLPEELLEDDELPRTFRKTIALLQAFDDLEKRDTEKEMVVDVPPSLAYRFELPRTDRKKTTTMEPPVTVVTPTKLSEEKRGQPEQVVLLENHNDPKFGNTP